MIGKVTRAARREHAARDQAFPLNILKQPPNVIRVVDAHGRVHNGQHGRDFAADRVARYKVGAVDGPNPVIELDRLSTLAGAIEVPGAAIERRIQLVGAFHALP